MLRIIMLLAVLSYTIAYISTSSFRRRSNLRMAVSKKDDYVVTLLKGDGIGPEIMEATIPVLDAAGKRFNFKLLNLS